MSPVIGITVDNKDNTASSGTYQCAIAYSRAVAAAGGVPVLLPHEVELVDRYVAVCDGFILTGGVDPRMEQFGEPTHPRAKPMDPRRQAFELALLDRLAALPDKAVLGVCLGMQLMGIHAGGRFNQHLPDTHDEHAQHADDRRHAIVLHAADSALAGGDDHAHDALDAPDAVVSHHNQAMMDAGKLRIVATAPDGVVEAIDDPGRRFYIGVQWHPERGGDGPLNRGLIERLVRACER